MTKECQLAYVPSKGVVRGRRKEDIWGCNLQLSEIQTGNESPSLRIDLARRYSTLDLRGIYTNNEI